MPAPFGRPPIDPSNIRPRLMLEVTSELMLQDDWPYRAVTIDMASHGGETGRYRLFAANHPDTVLAVRDRSLDVSILNPYAVLTMAHRGVGLFAEPVPVAAIAVLPHCDQLAFAVADRLGVESLTDIALRRLPLRVSVRGSLDAATAPMVDVVLASHGFSLADIRSWGGSVSYDQPMPNAPSRIGRVADGGLDAIFDEGVVLWADLVESAGMRILPIDEEHLTLLEQQGFRRGVLEQSRYPTLPADIPTVDYSGWPIFCRTDTDSRFVERFCGALLARRDGIQWDTGALHQDPLPLERMVVESPSTPMDVPLHPAARAFWLEHEVLPA